MLAGNDSGGGREGVAAEECGGEAVSYIVSVRFLVERRVVYWPYVPRREKKRGRERETG